MQEKDPILGSIQVIDRHSAYYPEQIREIPGPPKQLYCIGNPEALLRDSVAVVGSRKYTLYGKAVAKMLGRGLAEAEIPVVSGLANGIDSFAHEGTTAARGQAVAVLGSGFGVAHPNHKRPLMQDILRNGGCIISEYPYGVHATKFTFPERNRIISGLSKLVVVVEAGARSGALLTARLANEQGRTVYAVPGNINSQFSLGTNLLIRDGAVPMIVLSDLLAELQPLSERAVARPVQLEEEERAVYDVAVMNAGCTADEIAHALSMQIGRVNAILTMLEIKGILQSYAGKIFLAK